MKYYTIKSYSEKEAPFEIAWRVISYDGDDFNEYKHIFYNEIAGYCKCLEDMGFERIEIEVPELPDEKIIQTVYNATQNGELDIFGIYNNDKKAIEDAKKLWVKQLRKKIKSDSDQEDVLNDWNAWYELTGNWPSGTVVFD